ncbi:MAG: hypothetical protein ACRD96_13285, partial [Bryobacteraceae bacterium]
MCPRLISLVLGCCLTIPASDRPVAEWVLRMGGTVVVEGDRSRISDIKDLPDSAFRLHTVS